MPTTAEIAEALAAKALIDARKAETRYRGDGPLEGWVIRNESTTRTGATVVSYWHGLTSPFPLMLNVWGSLEYGTAVYPTKRQAIAAFRLIRSFGHRTRPQSLTMAVLEEAERRNR